MNLGFLNAMSFVVFDDLYYGECTVECDIWKQHFENESFDGQLMD